MTDTINCPLCGGKEHRVFYNNLGIDILSCRSCSFMFSHPMPDDRDLKKIYDEDYFICDHADQMSYDNYFEEEAAIRKSSVKRLKRMSKYTVKGRLFDVGCAVGYFMDTAKNLGWEVEGSDISSFCIKHATEELGLKAYEGTLPELRLKSNSYDVVTMWDIIEHLKDPVKEMKEVNRILKKDGLVVIMTPNVDSMIAKVSGKRWILYQSPHIHLLYFSPVTIKHLLEKTGFEVIKTVRFWHGGKYVPLSYALKRLVIYSPIFKPIRAFFRFFKLDKIAPWLDIGDNMVTYAKKVKSLKE